MPRRVLAANASPDVASLPPPGLLRRYATAVGWSWAYALVALARRLVGRQPSRLPGSKPPLEFL